MSRILAILLWLIPGACVLAQQYSFVDYSTSEGLPQSQVTTITQDRSNYLWIGTLGGVARFNGKEFLTYSTDNGLYNNRVSMLTFIGEDLYIGHEGGVSLMRHGIVINTWSLGNDNQSVAASVFFQKGNDIIVGTNGAGFFRIDGDELRPLPLNLRKLARIKDICVHDGVYYIATRDGLQITRDFLEFESVDSLANFSISSIRKFKGPQLVLSTHTNGLFIYNTANGHLERKRLVAPGIETPVLRNVFVDDKHNIWAVSKTGVFLVRMGGEQQLFNESAGLPTSVLRTVFQDREGTIWFGSDGKGLLKFPGTAFTFYNRKDGLPSDLILTVEQDRSGKYWFGTFDKGLICMQNHEVVRTMELRNNLVWCSARDVDGKQWFGTEFGLVSIDAKGETRYYYDSDGCPGSKITSLLRLNATDMLIGGSNGLSCYKKGRITPYTKNAEIPGAVRDLLRVGKDLYCATDRGLFLLQGDKAIQIGTKTAVYCVEQDVSGLIFYGTEEGLYAFRTGDDKVRKVTLGKSPADGFINFLTRAGENMYVGTNNGLYRLVVNDSDEIRKEHYGIEEGLISLETNLNSGYFDRQANLWFGTAEGVIRFNYSREKEYDFNADPNVRFRQILVNYKPFNYRSYSDSLTGDGLPQGLVLPYSMNNLTFELDGIALSNFEVQRYQFWMEGLEDTWSPTSANTTVTFSSLPSGEYTFHVRAISATGEVSVEKSISFVIRAPFYQTWYFFGMCALFITGLIVLFFRMRIQRERRKNYQEMLEYKGRLIRLEQQSLNASMNRHFIFNSLNSIQFFINTQDRLSANRYLSSFAKLIRKNLDSSSEEGSMVPLGQELERLELYLSLEQMRFKDRFTYTIDSDGVDLESVELPSMLLQPFAENSIIHGILPDDSKKGHIGIHIREQADCVVIRMDDNGIGINKSLQSKKFTEGDHKSHGMTITSKRIELFTKISQRKYELIGPSQVTDDEGNVLGTQVVIKIPKNNLED